MNCGTVAKVSATPAVAARNELRLTSSEPATSVAGIPKGSAACPPPLDPEPRSMKHHAFVRTVAVLLWLALMPAWIEAQVGGTADMKPVNELPNPYRTISDWAKLPAGRTWGSTNAVAIGADGISVWVAERCGGNQ